MWVAVFVSLLAVAYNNVVNHWKPFHGAAYVPLNLTFAALLTVLAATALDLSRHDLGLRGDLGDASPAVAIVAAFGFGAFALAGSRHARLIADRRVIHLRKRSLAFYVLVRIPLGTAVVEEVLFRGLLFAAWRAAGATTFMAAVFASVAFGLWHITPTIIGMRINHPAVSRHRVQAAVIAAVLLTTVAGLGLTWLRLRTGGLVAPILLHAGVNSVGALAALRAGSASEARP